MVVDAVASKVALPVAATRYRLGSKRSSRIERLALKGDAFLEAELR